MSKDTPVKSVLISAFAVLALTTTALTPVRALAEASAAKAVAPDPTKPVSFAQDFSDLKPDPAVRFGRLPNGMTYAIMRNATPPGTAAIRLRFEAGSLMESDKQLGLAHFLEHMAFNGSKNVPEGEMIKILERHGLQFGPDTNAHTGFGETVYELDLPKTHDEILDTGLMLMRETAGNLLLDQGAIDRERGVILGEERARATPSLRDYVKWSETAYAGQKYPARLPIGSTDIIKNAKRADFEDYYNAFYRPELATLVVVGDINVDAVEAKIKAKFSDWTARGDKPLRQTAFGDYKAKPQASGVYTETGLPDGISLTWSKPADEAYQSKARSTDDFIDSMRLALLNDRLERQAKLPETAFAAAGVYQAGAEHTAESVQLNITPKPGQAKPALTQAYTTVRQFALYGADQSELDRLLADYEAMFKQAMQGEKTRNNRGLAEGIVEAVGEHEVFTSPSQDFAFFQELKPRLTLGAINEGVPALFASDGPLLWHSGESTGDLDAAALTATYAAIQGAQLAKAEVSAAKPWPYDNFGAAVQPAKREEIKALGAVQLTWPNGVKATIKTTDFKDDEIGVTVRFAGGLAALSPSKNPPVFEASAHGVQEGGLGKLTSAELKDTLAGKIVGMGFDIGEDATVLSGGTNPSDYATQMQLLMAFATDSAYRADSWERLKSFVPNYYTSLNSTPEGVFQLKANAVLHSGDPRFGIPPQSEFLATTNDQVKALIDTQLKTAPVEITIVGDIPEADAVAEINKTFATLKPRTAVKPAADAGKVSFPKTNLSQVFEHQGRADQNMTFIAWPSADFFTNTGQARGLELLSNVLQLRLIDVVRESKAMTYSPNAGSYASNAFAGYGYLTAQASVKPEDSQAFIDALSEIVADLKAKPISDDELLRARKPSLDRLENDLKTNGYWNRVLPGTARDPRRIDAIQSRRDQLTKITAADIQKLAKTYLDMAKAMKIQVKAAAK